MLPTWCFLILSVVKRALGEAVRGVKGAKAFIELLEPEAQGAAGGAG